MTDGNVIPLDRLTPDELRQAQDAARAAMKQIGSGGISLSDLGQIGGTVTVEANRLGDANLTADITDEVLVGVVSVEEVAAAQEVAERVGEGGMKQAIKKARQKAIRQIEANRAAELAVARTPRNHAERRALKKNPNWSRDGSYAAMLPKRPKGTKSPKPKRRKK